MLNTTRYGRDEEHEEVIREAARLAKEIYAEKLAAKKAADNKSSSPTNDNPESQPKEKSN